MELVSLAGPFLRRGDIQNSFLNVDFRREKENGNMLGVGTAKSRINASLMSILCLQVPVKPKIVIRSMLL